MRIFNYTDKPVIINGIPMEGNEIKITDESFERSEIGHHTKSFHTLEQHHYLHIYQNPNRPNGYEYRLTEHPLPNIATFSFILVSTIALHLLVKIIQKLRQA